MPIPNKPTKILLIGAECTGKSTLAAALAQRYQGVIVPEYLRLFLDTKPQGYVCTFDDIVPIAQTQIKLENNAMQANDKLIICDTSAILLAIYSQWYFGKVADELWDMIDTLSYDAIFVTDDIGITWVADGQRDLPHGRHLMRDEIIKTLEKLGLSFVPITGSVDSRMAQVANYLGL